jgi:predicted nucleotidyltransferase
MDTPTEDMLGEMCEAVVRAEDPRCVVLIGSLAEGRAGPASDVDLLVVTKERFRADRTRRKVAASIRRALSRFRVPKDILVYSSDELLKWKESKNHILCTGFREGRVLYERPEPCPADALDGA